MNLLLWRDLLIWSTLCFTNQEKRMNIVVSCCVLWITCTCHTLSQQNGNYMEFYHSTYFLLFLLKIMLNKGNQVILSCTSIFFKKRSNFRRFYTKWVIDPRVGIVRLRLEEHGHYFFFISRGSIPLMVWTLRLYSV